MNPVTHDPLFPQCVVNADWITYYGALGYGVTQLPCPVNGLLLQLPSCIRSSLLSVGLVLYVWEAAGLQV